MAESVDGQDLRAPTTIEQMSPTQATTRLAEIGAQYKASLAPADSVAPPLDGVAPTTPAQARALLNARKSDPQWASRVLAGSGVEARQFQEWSALAASGDAAADVTIEGVNAIDDPLAQSRGVTEQMFDGLREAGMSEPQETMIRRIESGAATADVSEGDGVAAQRARAKLMRSPALREAYLSRSNPELDRVMFALNWAISNSQKDGRPMS